MVEGKMNDWFDYRRQLLLPFFIYSKPLILGQNSDCTNGYEQTPWSDSP